MNLREAYSILELEQGADADAAKKKYRELAKIWHPDKNKDPGAEDKFKKINEAYKVVSTGQGTDYAEAHQRQPGFSGFGFNPFDPFNRQNAKQRVVTNVELYTTISFKDSVLGCNQELKFNRQVKCQDCDGQGARHIHNGCTQCNGLGTVTIQRGNFIFSQTCNACHGQTQTENCNKCNSFGYVDAETSVNVTIPGGIINDNTLGLRGMGNYVTSMMGMDQYTEAHLHVYVTPDADLSLQGTDVVSNLEISLLEALRGSTKTVKTVLGESQINIKPLSRNKDEIIISQMGVNRVGNHRVILDVKYPKDINNLIGALDTKDI
ncbi:MAG TPA: DnaJ C-terminal domain-containing protein [Nitrososphaeraceae archaeon]|nr:DnaJ C-terminal domain-containing protein [Nitrososphaeraceae archaeon]